MTSTAFQATPPKPAPTLLQSMHRSAGNTGDKTCKVEAMVKRSMAARIFDEVIDAEGSGSISKLDFLKAMEKHKFVSEFVLPGVDCSNASCNEHAFEAVNSIFKSISGGAKRISRQVFAEYFRRKEADEEDSSNRGSTENVPDHLRARLQDAFDLIDSDADGLVSKLDFVTAVPLQPLVASFIVPGVNPVCIMSSASVFDAVDEVFDRMAKGNKRIDFANFLTHFREIPATLSYKARVLLRSGREVQRGAHRVLIIGPGFGRELNPQQCMMAMQSGFQIEWVNVPNPETPGFAMQQHLSTVKAAIDQYRPHLVASASKGGHYVRSLWNTGLWRGATLMLNAEPGLKELPKDVPIVIAHGGSDEIWPRSKEDLEELISTGSPNKCLLYTSRESGRVKTGFSRYGDRHNMHSLLTLDCLPRLMEAALSAAPEMQLLQSWRSMLGEDRLRAEEWLGYCPDDLKRFWASPDRRGLDGDVLHEVPRGSTEFQKVSTVFQSAPKKPAYYTQYYPQSKWACTGIVKIHRVENGLQESGSAQPYYDALQRSIEQQGLAFEPGLHTRWAFHGTAAVESITSNPMAGFQPLTSGGRVGAVWGTGTYFSRDAKYVMDAGFSEAEPDGSRKMLMCMVMPGMSCIGDPKLTSGVLPYRQKPHRYNSSVDSLCSPEIIIMQHPSSAYPAYVITFQ